MVKVGITGVSGLIGSHLATYLNSQGHYVVGIDKEDLPKDVYLNQYWRFDILSAKAPLELALTDCKVVYHCAAYAAEIMSLYKPAYIAEQNIVGSLKVLNACVNAGVKKVVFTSSNSVYGKQPICPYSENVKKRPDDNYAIGKLAVEQMIGIYRKTHGLNYIILRLHNVFGPQQNFKDAYRNVIAIWMNRIKRGKKPLIYGDGQQVRAFTYVSDVAPFIGSCAFNKRCTNKTFNVGSDEHLTIEEACKIVCKVCGWTEGYEFRPARPQEVKISYPSQEKAKGLGYQTVVPFENGVQLMWDWLKDKPPEEFKYWDDSDIEIMKNMPQVWREKEL